MMEFERPEALEVENGEYKDLLESFRGSYGIDASVEIMNVVEYKKKTECIDFKSTSGNLMMNSVPEAKIIADSISPNGNRLTTMEVKMHRFVLAEFNTHRVFSRNSASSRAIPVKKMLERVKNDTAMPVWWGKNQSGMSAREELTPGEIETAKNLWLKARDHAIETVEKLNNMEVHKQLVNRLLEPWLWHFAIVSSTEWTNAFAQRCHPDAQPETRAAFMAMQYAYYKSEPQKVWYGDWHLPYLDNHTRKVTTTEEQKKISVARCARVSYLYHNGVIDIGKDLEMYDKLVSANPMHASPFEHCATPNLVFSKGGNFKGWDQLRHFYPNENVKEFTPNHPDLV